MNARLIEVLIAGPAVGGAVLAWTFIPRDQRIKRFEDRTELSLDQIYGEFFAPKNLPKELACELWNEVSASLHLPPGKLRPTDRFDQELAAPKGWEHDDEILEVQWGAERRLRQNGTQGDLSQIKTVADYVEFFCNLAAQKQQAWRAARNEIPPV
jgi:hypothetical protein